MDQIQINVSGVQPVTYWKHLPYEWTNCGCVFSTEGLQQKQLHLTSSSNYKGPQQTAYPWQRPLISSLWYGWVYNAWLSSINWTIVELRRIIRLQIYCVTKCGLAYGYPWGGVVGEVDDTYWWSSLCTRLNGFCVRMGCYKNFGSRVLRPMGRTG